MVIKGILNPLNLIPGEGYHIEPAIHSIKTPIMTREPQAGSL
ncbi:conserved hypothetical protein [Escherichia coli]|uniref:Uncharacterized protein n=4 Tax=Enterobacteriaceae TaxID=543 RepID=A0A0H2VB80_ECOL6|nr:Hypothetical protein c3902 [Escherichia coli CFT073]ABE09021.1 hypothetical protein UTI89_C3575 [Escherichia coli UTI89]EGM60361.1 hypothetical protein SFJ1713_3646 [Shigella flexneri SFJ17B]EHX58215.1 hypothetical protein ECDEC13B_3331 [Escherichia coli DEC13B]EIN58030.1 hypothetical protein ECPA9_4448 [Escherichia coli PA9]EIO14113.1 hypothetical protein ECPA33_4301 [Escherichia coli PA33]EIQ18468.1 hypothetical protein SFK315_3282 [Shigella flexneri K-315]EIQ41556.1 hypothetical protei